VCWVFGMRGHTLRDEFGIVAERRVGAVADQEAARLSAVTRHDGAADNNVLV